MPYYDFYCDSCKQEFTRQYTIANMPKVGRKVKCEYCKKRAVRVFRASQISGYQWNPETSTGQQDIEHFDKPEYRMLYRDEKWGEKHFAKIKRKKKGAYDGKPARGNKGQEINPEWYSDYLEDKKYEEPALPALTEPGVKCENKI
jgi:DNA-directed RNA polymerase subunit RPC12/RpoP